MIRHTVPETVARDEISRYLKRAWPLLPGFVLRDLLKKKDVRVNGVKCGKGDFIRGGDALEIYADAKYFEIHAEVIFDDGKLIAAEKPQGLPSLPDADGAGADTMEIRIQRVHPKAKLCHRLDAGTGGVILAAADKVVAAQAFEAFKAHRIRKTYRALLVHRPSKDECTLHAHLVKDARHAEVRVTDHPVSGSKPIETRVKVLREAQGLFEVELEPVTGRTHQLRAHLAHVGCPILGDDKYGDREINKARGFAGRLCLWCAEIEIPQGSPLTGYVGEKFHADCPNWLKK